VDTDRHGPGSIAVDVTFPLDASPLERVRAAQAAERLGIDGVWFPDLTTSWSGSSRVPAECLTLASFTLAATSRLRVGTLVLNASTRPPRLTAAAVATMADLGGDRLMLGLGAGSREPREYAPGEMPDADGRVARLGALVDELRPAPPEHDPGHARIPLYVGAFTPRLARMAGQVADGVAVSLDGYGAHPRSAAELAAVARDAAAEAGRSEPFAVIVHGGPTALTLGDPSWWPGGECWERAADAGATRILLKTDPVQLAASASVPWTAS